MEYLQQHPEMIMNAPDGGSEEAFDEYNPAEMGSYSGALFEGMPGASAPGAQVGQVSAPAPSAPEPANEAGRWSTSGGEPSFVLPAGWSAVERRANDGLNRLVLQGPSGVKEHSIRIQPGALLLDGHQYQRIA